MLEKVSQVAEQVATSVSRRQFLGRLGAGAMSVAAAVGGVLALSAVAHAGPNHICSGNSGICAGLSANSGCENRDGPGRCARIRGTNDCHCRTSRK